jgi:hypothetical protein
LVAEWETAAVGSRHAVAVGETASARVSVSLWRVEGKGGLTSFSCGTGLEMSESDPWCAYVRPVVVVVTGDRATRVCLAFFVGKYINKIRTLLAVNSRYQKRYQRTLRLMRLIETIDGEAWS